ncbi:MAG TPA: GNAT family N-acetyltransferase [Solirubrobacteraceae bacterium]|nr:GNAT family N-acetyltransferase [Solirubrobacteraceae bacterium]
MSVEVAELDLGDAATLERLVALQRAGYAVEAQLIGAAELPPMRETPAELRASGETFLGARRDGRLVGAISFKREGATVDIHRLVVDPAAFRGGVATALLDALEAREAAAEHWTVGTGAANAPARALYERRGYAVTEERLVPGGIRWVRLDRLGAR